MKNISFNKRFDACIILNADYPEVNFFDKVKDLPLIAADGAANRMLKENRPINYIIGDLDSLDNNLNIPEGIELIRIKDQETNDFEKALRFCLDSGFNKVLVAGFHGGELEHSLNNWSVFTRFSKKLDLCIFDKGRYGFSVRSSSIIDSTPGETVSLIPQCHCTLTTSNLKWELDKEELAIGLREGARNVAIANNFNIQIHEGELIVFIDARLPFAF